jgi:hypothetical protein
MNATDLATRASNVCRRSRFDPVLVARALHLPELV